MVTDEDLERATQRVTDARLNLFEMACEWVDAHAQKQQVENLENAAIRFADAKAYLDKLEKYREMSK